MYGSLQKTASESFASASGLVRTQLAKWIQRVYRAAGPYGIFARTWPTGATVLWVSLILSAFLLVYYTR